MSNMYNLTRQEAAEKLWVSTRSIDRYVKAGKIRAKKEGKIVYVNSQDIENMSSSTSKKQEIITEKKYNVEKKTQNQEVKEVKIKEVYIKPELKNEEELNYVYFDLKKDIKKKDELIRELSLRLWRAEEIAKNSVNLIDYKKSQFLLEESKNHLTNQIEDLKEDKFKLERKLKYEKTSNFILVFVVVILLFVAFIIWFLEV